MRDETVDSFATRLSATRTRRAMSQSDLSTKGGIPATSISHFEAVSPT
jgi:ribosome-binding protein aMBF1 (putative translation factor)